MKLFIISVMAGFLAISCANNDAQSKQGNAKMDSTKFTKILWLDTAKSLGKITEGDKPEINFRFKNVGDKQLYINDARASCGCTVVDPPKKPFAPGEEGEIKAVYNSENHVGMQFKTITVSSNTPTTEELKFELEVVKK